MDGYQVRNCNGAHITQSLLVFYADEIYVDFYYKNLMFTLDEPATT